MASNAKGYIWNVDHIHVRGCQLQRIDKIRLNVEWNFNQTDLGMKPAEMYQKYMFNTNANKGRHPLKKIANFRALPELAKPPPTPNSGNLVLFFPDVKTTFYAYDREKVPMMIMIIAMIILIVIMVILVIMMKK